MEVRPLKDIVVSIAPHEREAMRQLMWNTRGLVSVVGNDSVHGQKLLAWAAMVEEVLERMER